MRYKSIVWRDMAIPDTQNSLWQLSTIFFLEDHPRTCKWLGSPPCICHLGHLEGQQPYLGDFLTMVMKPLPTSNWDDPPSSDISHLAINPLLNKILHEGFYATQQKHIHFKYPLDPSSDSSAINSRKD